MKTFIASLAIASSAIAISLSTSDCTVKKPSYLPSWEDGLQSQCPEEYYNQQKRQPLDCHQIKDGTDSIYDQVYNSADWDYYATEGYYFIYWNFWDVAWPFASMQHQKNPWKWDSDFDDWYLTWGDIADVYNTCWE